MKGRFCSLKNTCDRFRSSTVFRICAIIISLLIISGVFILLFSGKKPNVQETGFMRVCVHDGETDMPICGARVVIPETGFECMTDEDGFTPVMELPVYYDEHYASFFPQDYGLITVLVYSDGYVPYALYFTHIEPNVLRRGPNVWLFPGDGAPFSIIEGPDDDWSNRLIEEYKP